MAELVYAPHSKCVAFGIVGSSPTCPTTFKGSVTERFKVAALKAAVLRGTVSSNLTASAI